MTNNQMLVTSIVLSGIAIIISISTIIMNMNRIKYDQDEICKIEIIEVPTGLSGFTWTGTIGMCSGEHNTIDHSDLNKLLKQLNKKIK